MNITEWFGTEPMLARASRALMHLLRTDSVALAHLQALDGRVIAIEVKGLNVTLYAAVAGAELWLATASMQSPDVTLSGRVSDFLAFAQARRQAQPAATGKLRIMGDLGSAQAVQRLLEELEIDWEALLAARVGDVPAQQFGRGVRSLVSWWRASAAALTEDLTRFVQQEQPLTPSAEHVRQFAHQTTGLASDVERLAARIAQLDKRARP